MNISLRATDNINDNASTSIQKGFGNDSTPEGFILQLTYRETTFEITFTCVILTIAFFGCIGNLATIGKRSMLVQITYREVAVRNTSI